MSDAPTGSTTTTPTVGPVGKTRRPNRYALFVRDSIKEPEIQALPPRERFRVIAERWRGQKAGQTRQDSYTSFLQRTIQEPEIQALSPQERFKAVAIKWKASKSV